VSNLFQNPTGQVLQDEDLKEVQDLCRDKCTLVKLPRSFTNSQIVDEFYSGYLYNRGCNGETVSSAEFVEGNFRYHVELTL